MYNTISINESILNNFSPQKKFAVILFLIILSNLLVERDILSVDELTFRQFRMKIHLSAACFDCSGKHFGKGHRNFLY